MKKLAIAVATLFAVALFAGCASSTACTDTMKPAAKSTMKKDVKGEMDYKGETRMK